MVQVQAAEHIAKALLLGPFEMVPLKHGSRTVLLCSLAGHIRVVVHQVAVVLPAHGGELLHLGAFSRLMLDPGVLLLRLVGWRQSSPLALGQLGRQPVQLVGPLVVADAPATKFSQFNAVEEFARAGAAVGVQIAGPALPAML